MPALFPALTSAIMGSGANKSFDPRDPTSMPYEERKTGFGRFLTRLGGTDAGALNNEYNAKRGMMDIEQGNRAQLIDKEMQARKALQESGQEHDWRVLQSRLANEAVLQQQQQGFQSQLNSDRLSAARNELATDQFNRYGTWDPIVQQDIATKVRNLEMNTPRPLGGNTIFDPKTGRIYRYEEGGPSLDPNSPSAMTPGRWTEQRFDDGLAENGTGTRGAGNSSISKEDLIKAGLIVPNGTGSGQQQAGTTVLPEKNKGGFLSRVLKLLQKGVDEVPTPMNPALARNFTQDATTGLGKVGGFFSRLKSRLDNIDPNTREYLNKGLQSNLQYR